jgi:hypothetical protein
VRGIDEVEGEEEDEADGDEEDEVEGDEEDEVVDEVSRKTVALCRNFKGVEDATL